MHQSGKENGTPCTYNVYENNRKMSVVTKQSDTQKHTTNPFRGVTEYFCWLMLIQSRVVSKFKPNDFSQNTTVFH